MLIGGWSLGIEFVFYLLFPLLMRALGIPWLGWSLLAALAARQVLWIQGTIGLRGWDEGSIAYHHAPAFAAYFLPGV